MDQDLAQAEGALEAVVLTIGRPAQWAPRVVSLRGVEALSAPYRFEVVVAIPRYGEGLSAAELLGAQARLVLRTSAAAPRVVAGLIASVGQLGGATGVSGDRYRLRIVPRFGLLKHTRNSRIFQDLSVPEVVSAALDLAGVTHLWRHLGSYPKRAYCVQHQESDFDFVSRLLAEEGIWYGFDQPPQDADEDVMILADDASQYEPIAGDTELVFARAGGFAAEEHVSRFGAERNVRPGSMRLRHYDYHRPRTSLMANASVPAADLLGAEAALDVYEHHAEFEEGNLAASGSERMLEQIRRHARRAHGQSSCRRFVPGCYFSLIDSSGDTFEGDYALTHVVHRFSAERIDEPETDEDGGAYHNRFRCVPRGSAYRPARVKRRLQQGLETATVVGPGGEEIYTDSLGRVKVQFHWDIRGQYNENSSCWLRLVQPWSGERYGMQFIPRVGTEVVVGFIGGDTDRPVVMGSVYNGIHAPPFDLQGDKSKSGIRTATTPGGGGGNELSFEDAAGREEIHLRAERDLREVIGNDRAVDIGANLHVTIGSNSIETVGGERVEIVRGGRSSTVMGDAVRQVIGSGREVVEGDRLDVVNSSAEWIVADRLTTRIGGADERQVAGDSRSQIGGDQDGRVAGCVTLQVGRPQAERSYAVHAEGLAELSGSKLLNLVSEQEITLTCGRSSIRLTPDQIELVSPLVLLTGEGAAAALGEDRLRLRASDDLSLVADSVILRSQGASLGLDRDARLGGERVRLGERDDSDELSPGVAPTPTTIELVDQDGNPMPHHRFKVFLADGSTRAGLLDRNGQAVIDLDEPADVVFDEVVEVRSR